MRRQAWLPACEGAAGSEVWDGRTQQLCIAAMPGQ